MAEAVGLAASVIAIVDITTKIGVWSLKLKLLSYHPPRLYRTWYVDAAALDIAKPQGMYSPLDAGLNGASRSEGFGAGATRRDAL